MPSCGHPRSPPTTSSDKQLKRFVLGLAALGVYVVTSYLIARTTVAFRPVLDGFAPPQPYQYVDPPQDLRDTNVVPKPLDETYDVGGDSSQGLTFTTPDGQVQVIVDSDALGARRGERSVRIRITPLGPRGLPEPGDGLFVQGNAYRIQANYERSKAPVALAKPATIIVRYPFAATKLGRLDGPRWRVLRSQLLEPSLQVFAESRELGIFAAVGPPHGGRRWWIPLIAAGAGIVAALIGYRAGRRRTKRTRRRVKQPRRRRPR